MRRLGRTAAALAAAIVLASAALQAQPQAESATPALEPSAMKALTAMGAYLRSLKAFQVLADTTDESVLDDGQKVQYSGTVTIVARMPNGLRAEVSDDRYERMWLYDGRSFTLFAKRVGLYATVAAPPTVGELADALDEQYGLSVPLEDLFRWGAPGYTTNDISSAADLGPGVVAGTTCQHYAFRQPEIDWQIWIQKGDFPLPRKLVITTRSDEARPQHTAVYTWNLAPSFNDAAFTFDPPAGAGRVILARAAGAGR